MLGILHDILYLSCCIEAAAASMVILAFLGHKISIQCLSSTVTTIKMRKRLFSALLSMYLLCLTIFTTNLSRSLLNISNELFDSMERGMGSYLLDKDSKITLDTIQSQLKCCGAHNHTDWYRVAWLQIDSLIFNSTSLEKYIQRDGQVLFPTVPFSCCRSDYLGVCHNDPWSRDMAASLYRVGCVKSVTSILLHVTEWIIRVGLCYGVLSCCAHVLLHYMYTSSRNAILLKEDIAPGWLYGPGDLAYGGEDTLSSYDKHQVTITTEIEKGNMSHKCQDLNLKYVDYHHNETPMEWCRIGKGKYL
ncbi:hypothetical protein M8J76_007439 [Diaphorina citri]|nr:hypothetical protein M8J76_007439 [Diaphorina citri]